MTHDPSARAAEPGVAPQAGTAPARATAQASTVPLDRSHPPTPGPRRPARFPELHTRRLDNGLRVLIAPRHEAPIFTGQLLVPAGGQWNPLDRPGLADIHGGLLDQGTSRLDAAELARQIEVLGGSLTSAAGWNMAYLETSILSENLDAALELTAESIVDPAFPEDKVAWLTSHNKASLLRRRSNPRYLAEDTFARVVYRGTPYAFPELGSTGSLEELDRQAIVEFYSRHATPRGGAFVAAGDCDPDDVCRRLESLLADWQPSPEPERPEIAPEPLAERQVHVVDRPGSAQTQLHMGHAGPPRRDPDFETLLLWNTLLGGKFTSRLNLNLRERHGFTYGVSTRFGRRRGPGPFFITTAVATDSAGAAVRETLYELDRLLGEPIPEDELRESIDYFLGVFPYTLQTITDLSRRLEQMAIFGLPDDYYDHYPARLAHLDSETVSAAAARHVRSDALAIVAVGPADQLVPQLEPYGPVRVHQPG